MPSLRTWSFNLPPTPKPFWTFKKFTGNEILVVKLHFFSEPLICVNISRISGINTNNTVYFAKELTC